MKTLSIEEFEALTDEQFFEKFVGKSRDVYWNWTYLIEELDPDISQRVYAKIMPLIKRFTFRKCQCNFYTNLYLDNDPRIDQEMNEHLKTCHSIPTQIPLPEQV